MELIQEQYRAIDMMLANKKNHEIVKALGITEETFFKWLNDPYFVERLNDSIYEKFKKDYYNKGDRGPESKDIKQRSIVLTMPVKYYEILEKHFESRETSLGNGILSIILDYMEKNKMLNQ
jgi:hypothetical protein